MHVGEVGKVAGLGVRKVILVGVVTQHVVLERKLMEKGGIIVLWEVAGI